MKLLITILAILLLSSSAYAINAQSYEAAYELDGKAVVNITISTQENPAYLDIPKDSASISSSQAYEVIEDQNTKTLKFNSPSAKLAVGYTTDSVIEHSSDEFFLLDLSGINSTKISVTLKLPAKATLKYPTGSTKQSIMPKGSLSTDGQRITISWNEKDLGVSESAIVIYKIEKPSFTITALAGMLALGLGILAVLYIRRKKAEAKKEKGLAMKTTEAKHSETKHEEQAQNEQNKAPTTPPWQGSQLTKNLFEEEKQIVEALIASGNDGLWQKQLEIQTGLPKVRLSRKLRSLEQRGIIEKIPYGNTNRIRLPPFSPSGKKLDQKEQRAQDPL